MSPLVLKGSLGWSMLSHVQMDIHLHTKFAVLLEHLTCDVLREAGRSAQEEEEVERL